MRREKEVGREYRRMSMVQILCMYVCMYVWKWKNETFWNYFRNRERGQRRMIEGVNSIKIYCKHFCKYHNVHPVQH
jgi:hypothetical protein